MNTSKSRRCNFLNKCSNNELNEYFNSLQKLSHKNKFYKDIYYEDVEYIRSNGRLHQVGGGLKEWLQNLLGLKPYGHDNNIYCQLKMSSENCSKTIKKLEDIKNSLTREASNTGSGKDWEQKIDEFMQMLICCDNKYHKRKHKIDREEYITPIMKKIVENDKFIIKAHKMASEIFEKMDNKSQEILKISDDISNFKYQELIMKHGFGKVFLALLMKVLEARMNDRT